MEIVQNFISSFSVVFKYPPEKIWSNFFKLLWKLFKVNFFFVYVLKRSWIDSTEILEKQFFLFNLKFSTVFFELEEIQEEFHGE